jgi:hypothetical protein
VLKKGTVSTEARDLWEPFVLTLVEYDSSPVMREYRVAAANALAILSFEGIIGSEYYV